MRHVHHTRCDSMLCPPSALSNRNLKPRVRPAKDKRLSSGANECARLWRASRHSYEIVPELVPETHFLARIGLSGWAPTFFVVFSHLLSVPT